MLSAMPELWKQLAARASIDLDQPAIDKLNHYLDLLFAANATMNLTRITDRAAAEIQHVADALTLLPFLPAEPFSLADVGSGGGVPGLPLAIVRPDARVTLIESTKKKAAFLQSAVQQLELRNVTVLPVRAEEAGRGEQREHFDIVAARAVATLNWLAEWCLPLTKVGGRMLAMKGPKVREELDGSRRSVHSGGGMPPVLHPVELPGMNELLIVEIRKTSITFDTVPRDPTTAKGRPL